MMMHGQYREEGHFCAASLMDFCTDWTIVKKIVTYPNGTRNYFWLMVSGITVTFRCPFSGRSRVSSITMP